MSEELRRSLAYMLATIGGIVILLIVGGAIYLVYSAMQEHRKYYR